MTLRGLLTAYKETPPGVNEFSSRKLSGRELVNARVQLTSRKAARAWKETKPGKFGVNPSMLATKTAAWAPLHEISSRKLSEPELVKAKAQLTSSKAEPESKEFKLVKGIASALALSDSDLCRVLAIKASTGASLQENLKKAVTISGDLEDRIRVLFEIISAAASFLRKDAKDPGVRHYLRAEGYLAKMRNGHFENLLETKYLLASKTGGVWGRKNDAVASTDQA